MPLFKESVIAKREGFGFVYIVCPRCRSDMHELSSSAGGEGLNITERVSTWRCEAECGYEVTINEFIPVILGDPVPHRDPFRGGEIGTSEINDRLKGASDISEGAE